MKVLIINRSQYGFHIDTYFYTKYLAKIEKLKYICYDQGLTFDGEIHCNIEYLKPNRLKILRIFELIFNSYKEIKTGYDVVFIKYFPFCSFLKWMSPSNVKMVLDIRSSAINSRPFFRLVFNYLIRIEARNFPNITIISNSLALYMNLKNNNPHILPLGSDFKCFDNILFDHLRLIYVGTFNSRNINLTIEAFNNYITHYDDNKATYDLIGGGEKHEVEKIENIIRAFGLEDRVIYHGYLTHSHVLKIMQRCNVGIAYVPIIPMFDSQPPTKTYEYLFCGLPTIATSTQANSEIINCNNGILINDDLESFEKALLWMRDNLPNYDSQNVAKTVSHNNWAKIVNENLFPYLLSLVED